MTSQVLGRYTDVADAKKPLRTPTRKRNACDSLMHRHSYRAQPRSSPGETSPFLLAPPPIRPLLTGPEGGALEPFNFAMTVELLCKLPPMVA